MTAPDGTVWVGYESAAIVAKRRGAFNRVESREEFQALIRRVETAVRRAVVPY